MGQIYQFCIFFFLFSRADTSVGIQLSHKLVICDMLPAGLPFNSLKMQCVTQVHIIMRWVINIVKDSSKFIYKGIWILELLYYIEGCISILWSNLLYTWVVLHYCTVAHIVICLALERINVSLDVQHRCVCLTWFCCCHLWSNKWRQLFHQSCCEWRCLNGCHRW